MKKVNIFILIMFLTTALLVPAKSVVMPELLKPELIIIDNDEIFLCEGVEIFVYSLKDFTLKKKFGSKGEGPMEFLATPETGGMRLDVLPKHILVNSIGKLSYFTRDGEFVKVVKSKKGFSVYRPLIGDAGEQYGGLSFAIKDKLLYVIVGIYDAELNRVKEIFEQKNPYQQGRKMNPFLGPPRLYSNGKDRLVINNFVDGSIPVFNAEGERVYTLSPDYRRKKVTSADRKAILHFYQTEPSIKDNWPIIKNQLEFPANFPEVRICTVTNGHVYIETYNREENKSEFFIYKLDNGEFVKKVFLPVENLDVFWPYPYTFYGDSFYQVVENPDTEKNELRIFPVR